MGSDKFKTRLSPVTYKFAPNPLSFLNIRQEL